MLQQLLFSKFDKISIIISETLLILLFILCSNLLTYAVTHNNDGSEWSDIINSHNYTAVSNVFALDEESCSFQNGILVNASILKIWKLKHYHNGPPIQFHTNS